MLNDEDRVFVNIFRPNKVLMLVVDQCEQMPVRVEFEEFTITSVFQADSKEFNGLGNGVIFRHTCRVVEVEFANCFVEITPKSLLDQPVAIFTWVFHHHISV